METTSDFEFLDFVVKALVTFPEAVRITRDTDDMGVLLTLDVHPDDMGKVIGRDGNTAKAIRTLLRVIGMKHNARVNMKINEPEGSSHFSKNKGSDTSGVVAGKEKSTDIDAAIEEVSQF